MNKETIEEAAKDLVAKWHKDFLEETKPIDGYNVAELIDWVAKKQLSQPKDKVCCMSDERDFGCNSCKNNPQKDIESLKSDFYKKFGEQSFRGYPLEQCDIIWNFFLHTYTPKEQPAKDIEKLKEAFRRKITSIIKLNEGIHDNVYYINTHRVVKECTDYFIYLLQSKELQGQIDNCRCFNSCRD
jgi:hypothetical protein